MSEDKEKKEQKPVENQGKKEEKKEDSITLSKSQLKEYIDSEIAKATKTNQGSSVDVGELVNALKSTNNQGRMFAQQAVPSEYINMEDFLDTPKTFFSYKFIYTIYDDFRYGTAIKTPYGRPIKFHPIYRYQKKGSTIRDTKVITVSMSKVHSKKEVKWLREHSKFNISFFETTKDAERVDDMFADKLSEAANLVNGMNQAAVIKRAQIEKLEITSDLEEMRRKLIIHLAEKKMKEKRQYVKPISQDWNPKTDMHEVVDENVKTDAPTVSQQSHY